MQCSAASLLILAVTAILLYFKFGIADARGLDSAETCAKVDAGEVTLCLEPMIQLSEELAQNNPIVNRIIFPLFSFKHPDLKRICRIWTEMHLTCLSENLRTRCSQHGLLKILNSLFSFACSEPTSELFFDHFSCLAEVTETHQSCVEMMVVSSNPDLRPDSKCDPVPHYYSCLEEGIMSHCNVTGLNVFRLTLDTFGCPLPEIEHKFLLGEDTNIGVEQPAEELKGIVLEHGEIPAISGNPVGSLHTINVQSPLIESEQREARIENNIRQTSSFFRESLNEQEPVNPRISESNEINEVSFVESKLVSSNSKATAAEKQFEHQEGTFADDSSGSVDEIIRNRVLSVQQNVVELQHRPIDASSDDIQIIKLRGDESDFVNGPAIQGERTSNEISTSTDQNFLSSQSCPEPTRSQARTCLQPVMQMWHRLAQGEPMLSNVTFPLFLMDRNHVLDLCDLYASAFLDCQLETFQICSQDPIVEFSDAMLGYACGNAIEFFRSYDCLSVIAQDSGSEECRKKIQIGIAEDFDRRCAGINGFFLCIRETVEAICPVKSLTVLKEAIKYYGCDV